MDKQNQGLEAVDTPLTGAKQVVDRSEISDPYSRKKQVLGMEFWELKRDILCYDFFFSCLLHFLLQWDAF